MSQSCHKNHSKSYNSAPYNVVCYFLKVLLLILALSYLRISLSVQTYWVKIRFRIVNHATGVVARVILCMWEHIESLSLKALVQASLSRSFKSHCISYPLKMKGSYE